MSELPASRAAGPVQVSATVVSVRAEGAYTRIVLEAPQPAGRAVPGQFVALAVGTAHPGTAPTATLLRRCFSIAGAEGDRLSLLISAKGPGSTWLTRRQDGDTVDLLGPLGHPFPAPAAGAATVLVAGGYGAAPMLWWAELLLASGHPVACVFGAASADRIAEAATIAEIGVPVFITTDDGTLGAKGRVTDLLAEAFEAADPRRTGAPVEVYACGPMAMLRAVTERAGEIDRRTITWCATEESMACGIGVCMTCVLPVRQSDGSLRMSRTCTDGPTFAGTDIGWDEIGRVLA